MNRRKIRYREETKTVLSFSDDFEWHQGCDTPLYLLRTVGKNDLLRGLEKYWGSRIELKPTLAVRGKAHRPRTVWIAPE